MSNKYRFFIAGVKFHDLPSVVEDMKEGEVLTLVNEPENKYDSNAIRIERNGVMLGYVPAKYSPLITVMMDEEAVQCKVTDVNPQAKPHMMCAVEVGGVDD